MRIECDGGWAGCLETGTMIGEKGYAYCSSCGPQRRGSGYERVRRMTPTELRTLQSGGVLKSYSGR